MCEPGLHKDNRLGKVSLLCDNLKAKSMTEEQWYPLQYIDADSEVQVDPHLLCSLPDVVLSLGKAPFITEC